LHEADLQGADLEDASLDGADLSGADLSFANMDGADLRRASLSIALLYRAFLDGAFLDGAFLREADLREASLREAHLTSADLSGADLSEANLCSNFLDKLLVGWVQIGVHDTGPGLTSAQIAHLFQPFNRLGAEYTRVPGTGLGLAMARELTRRMAGDLSIASEPGVGSTFTLSLTLQAPFTIEVSTIAAALSSALDRDVVFTHFLPL